ncbi:UNVERIFIED_CONTAM: hypothetical protein Slati_1116900 [Sesamum latifolium]|uniref:Uncharacterized protein n=1 Tax=Sesamum latifolium TaxID=2727402 RepID=A0AAW2XC80_9LAMI
MPVCDDDDVATMFKMHKASKKINLYVANDLKNVEGGNEEGAIEKGVDGDDDHGLARMVLKKRGLRVMMMRGLRVKKYMSDVYLFGYEFDNYCEVVNSSDEEFFNDPFVGLLNKDEVTIPKNPMQKIKLEKGMIFTNVDMFREVLREYGGVLRPHSRHQSQRTKSKTREDYNNFLSAVLQDQEYSKAFKAKIESFVKEEQLASLTRAIEGLTKHVQEQDAQIARLIHKADNVDASHIMGKQVEAHDEAEVSTKQHYAENDKSTKELQVSSDGLIPVDQLKEFIKGTIRSKIEGSSKSSLTYSKPYAPRIDSLKMPIGYQPPKFQ